MRVSCGLHVGSTPALDLPKRTFFLQETLSLKGLLGGEGDESLDSTVQSVKDALTAGQRALAYWGNYPGSTSMILTGYTIMRASQLLLLVAPGLLVDMVTGNTDRRLMDGLIKASFAMFGVNLAANLWATRFVARTSARVMNDIRYQLFQHLQQLSLSYYGQMKTGDIVARFTSDLSDVEEMMSKRLPETMLDGAGLVLSIPLAFALQWQLTLLALISFGFITLATTPLMPYAAQATYRRKQAQGETAAWLQERVMAHPVVKAFGLEDLSLEQLRQRLADLGKKSERARFLTGLVEMPFTQGAMLTQLLVLGVGVAMLFNGTISLGTLVSFSPLLLRMSKDYYKVSEKTMPGLVMVAGVFRRLDEILTAQPQIVDAPGALPLPHLQKEISLANVSFSYNDSTPQLDRVSLTIPIGGWVALVGPSGAGKTTLLKLLLRLYEVQSGIITLDDLDIRAVTQQSLRAQMGIVFQEPILFNGSLRENIRMGKLDAADEEIQAAARAAEIHDFIVSLPHGYDTSIGELGSKLSGGERQRIAIARALLRNPAVLLLDEPTSALDAATEAALATTIERLARTRTVVTVTHRLAAVQHADQIHVINQGRIVEQGSHQELVSCDGLYAELWRTQQHEGRSIRQEPGASTPFAEEDT